MCDSEIRRRRSCAVTSSHALCRGRHFAAGLPTEQSHKRQRCQACDVQGYLLLTLPRLKGGDARNRLPELFCLRPKELVLGRV